MPTGFEIWEIWETPEADQVRLRYETLEPPDVQGSATARAVVLEIYERFDATEQVGVIPRLWGYMRESLTTIGWRLVGHARAENLASAHLQAAVRQAEVSSIRQLEAARIAAETGGDVPQQLVRQITAGSALSRAIEASRNAVILAVAALEAFINEAARRLAAWGHDEDNMSLRSKWILVPALLANGATFDRGRQPFQEFHSLVVTRNRLAHPKPEIRTFEGAGSLLRAYREPSVLDVRPEDGRKACMTARKMILEFSRIVGDDPPSWCAYVPNADSSDLEAWSRANILTGIRDDPDFPRFGTTSSSSREG